MNQPISIPEGNDMPTFWRYLIRGWLTCHWLTFLGYLELYRMDVNGELSDHGNGIAGMFGIQFFGMILGVLVCLMFPGKRLKYSALFIFPVILSVVVAVTLHQLGYDK